MKYLFFLLLLILPSCEKTYCWDCILNTSRMTGPPPNMHWIYSQSKVTYCDRTEKEIDKIIYDHFHKGNQYMSNMSCTKN